MARSAITREIERESDRIVREILAAETGLKPDEPFENLIIKLIFKRDI